MNNLNNSSKGGTFCLGNAAVIIDASAKADAEVTPATVPYCIDGVMYTLTSADGDIQFDGLTQADLYTCLYLVCIDSAGTITVVQGTPVLTANITAGSEVLHWPEPTADTCPFAGAKIVNASDAVFTGGTTLLDAVTTTFYNLFSVPTTTMT